MDKLSSLKFVMVALALGMAQMGVAQVDEENEVQQASGKMATFAFFHTLCVS